MLALPAPIAHALGVSPWKPIKLQVGASVVPALLGGELTEHAISAPLVDSPIALAPLAYAQQLTGMQGRITRVFVRRRSPDRSSEVHTGLVRLAAGRLNVEPADYEATLFSQAAAPVDQSTETFAAICALVGFMFAYCAMLLTTAPAPRADPRTATQRRDPLGHGQDAARSTRSCWPLSPRSWGWRWASLLSIVAFSRHPAICRSRFPIGSQRIVTWESVLIAVGGGTCSRHVWVS